MVVFHNGDIQIIYYFSLPFPLFCNNRWVGTYFILFFPLNFPTANRLENSIVPRENYLAYLRYFIFLVFISHFCLNHFLNLQNLSSTINQFTQSSNFGNLCQLWRLLFYPSEPICHHPAVWLSLARTHGKRTESVYEHNTAKWLPSRSHSQGRWVANEAGVEDILFVGFIILFLFIMRNLS